MKPALEIVSSQWPGVVLTDVKMPGDNDGMSVLSECLKIDPDQPVVLITGHGDISMAVKAMRAGAYDFIEKPFNPEHLIEIVKKAIENRNLVLENRRLRKERQGRSETNAIIIGNTTAITTVRDTITKIANTNVDVLIHGETGTGKELVAKCLHLQSKRCWKPFVAVNCGAIPETIFENELFGHEAAAFTGAAEKQIGKIEYSDGGTLFLDEIESMPLQLQVKVLRVLQERVVTRLGSNDSVALDMRVVAATKVDLLHEVENGRFREDLYYRLDVLKIDLPPLRERLEDIPVLFRHCLLNSCAKYKKELPLMTREIIANLMSRKWAGNIRELQNTADRYVLGYEDGDSFQEPDHGEKGDSFHPLSLPRQIEAIERSIISAELENQKGNIKATCESLGLPYRTLNDKMRKYKLDRANYL